MTTRRATRPRFPFTDKELALIMRGIADVVTKADKMPDPTVTGVLANIMQNLALVNQNLAFIGNRIDELLRVYIDSSLGNLGESKTKCQTQISPKQ